MERFRSKGIILQFYRMNEKSQHMSTFLIILMYNSKMFYLIHNSLKRKKMQIFIYLYTLGTEIRPFGYH